MLEAGSNLCKSLEQAQQVGMGQVHGEGQPQHGKCPLAGGVRGSQMDSVCSAEPLLPLQEDSSSTELDVPAADLHSSTEDLLSDSALHGTEYYKDLGLLSPPANKTVPEMAARPEAAPQAASAIRLLEERSGALGKMSVDVAFSNPISCSVRYGEADCHFLNKAASTAACPAEEDEALDLQEASESFPTLVRSMSTSRRHSWESPLSPVDCKRR